MVLLKEFFEKESADNKKGMKNYPSRQSVNSFKLKEHIPICKTNFIQPKLSLAQIALKHVS